MTTRNGSTAAQLRDVLPVAAGTSSWVGIVLTVADVDPWLALIGFVLGVAGLLAWADKPRRRPAPPPPPPECIP